jgi:hypothetical protein
MTANSVRDGLDRLGLPWRTPKAELKARAGISHWPLPDDPVVFVETAQSLPGLIRPLSFRDAGQSPAMPPAHLHGYFWVRDDTKANLAAARAAFEPYFGKPRDGRGMASNIEAWEWADPPARVRLTVWPPKLNRDFGYGSNSVHDAEPRTRSACSISIQSGYRPTCSPLERQWLEAMDVAGIVRPPFRPGARLSLPKPGLWSRLFGARPRLPDVATPQSLLQMMNERDVHDNMLEFRREPFPEYAAHYGKVGVAPGGSALLVCTADLLIVPAAQIEAIEIITITPGRSFPSGGTEINTRCRLPYAPGRLEPLHLGFAQTGVAEALAARLGIGIDRREEWGD